MSKYQHVCISADLHFWYDVWVPKDDDKLSREVFDLKIFKNIKVIFFFNTKLVC